MKIRTLIPAILVWFYTCVSAQQRPVLVTNFHGQEINRSAFTSNATAKGYTSADEAKNIINNIIAVVGLKPKFEIREANIPNAAAVIYNGKRYILYNPSFVYSLNKAAGNQWAAVSILAHEIGHHLNGHTLEAGGSRPEIELEADEFSGFVLKKMGATLAEAQVAMKIAAAQTASHSHPAQADRLYAIAKGYAAASKQIDGVSSDVGSAYKKPVEDRPLADQPAIAQARAARTQQSIFPEKYIFRDVHLYNDPRSSYHVTVRSHLVKVDGNGYSVLGKLISNQSDQFPVAIVDETGKYWLINKYGRILTATGKEIGYLSQHG